MKYRKFCKNPKCGKAFMGTKTQQYCSSECRVPTYKPKKKVVKKTKPCTIDEIATKAKALLDKGVEIKQVNGLKSSFSISPADGSYKVNFGEAEFESFLKSFLRPQMVELLF